MGYEVDDTFAAVYREAKAKQQKLMELVKEIQLLGKQLIEIAARDYKKTIFFRNLATDISTFIQSKLAEVKRVHLV